ncbi:MAG: InlB B-repeat-containing protein [Ruminococcus sp.]
MKKSFAENCIRYISTATALVLALAMLCCANFSASAKDLGSNLTITDTTLLLQDINTTTNTTPAKTKDLIASGANVDVVSTGIKVGDTIYFRCTNNYSAVYVHLWYRDSSNNDTAYTAWGSSPQMTNLGSIDGKYYYSYTLTGSTTYDYNYVLFKSDQNTKITSNDVAITSGMNCYDLNTTSWSNYATTYTVTFNYNGHGTNTSETVDANTQVNAPTEPTAEGYTFDGWFTNEGLTTEATFPYTVTSNVTFYAKWTSTSSGDVSDDIISVLKGEKIMIYAGEENNWGQKNYYIRSNSSTSSTVATISSSDSSSQVSINSIKCYYGYTYVPVAQYYLSNSSGWSGVQMSSTTEAGYFYILNNNSSLGGSSNNVYVSSASGSATTTVTDATVSTSFTSGSSGIGTTYSLVYYLKSGTTYSKIATTQSGANSYLASVADGEYTLYTCLTDGNITVLKDTDTFTKSSVTKYDVNVHYNGKGGTDYTSQVEENTDFAEPTSTSVTGYTLEGWYTTSTFATGTKVTFPLTITDTTDLYAKWTANEYTVTFNSNGGSAATTTKKVTYNSTYGTLPDAGTKTGYDFAGWYTSATSGTQVESTDTVKITSNTTLYAHWTAKEYNITYVLSDGTINGTYATKYTYGVGATLPTDVTKDGYTFKGWYDNEGLTGDAVTSISKTATGDKTFYAKWELNAFKHKYVFLEVSGKDWFYNGSCVGVVSFDGGTTYIKMNELFTDSSSYNTDVSKSNLLFAEVPENTTKITFARNNIENGEVKYWNSTSYGYSAYTTNNLLTLASGNDTLNGTWSTVDYTPVPVSVTHGANGTVVASKTLADTTTKITVKNGETKYFDSATTGISVAVTPETDYRIKSFTVNGEEKKSVFENLETGGTYNLGTLSATEYDIQATFEEVPKENPTVTISNIPNSTVSFTYIDANDTEQTVTAPGDYVVKYKSDISLVISPNPGYHLVSITGLTTESTLPVAGNVTATASQIKTDLTVSYVLEKNPTVTIEVPANCTVEFTYTNDNGVSATATTAGTYSVYYGSDISYKVTPNDGYYVETMTGVTTKTPTPPVAGVVTGKSTNITADVAKITCTLKVSPKVTVECYDSKGTKLTSGVGITVDGGSVVKTTQTKTVLYNDSTGATFTASVENSQKYVFLGYYDTSSATGDKYATGSYDDYSVTVTDGSIKLYNVCSDIKIYAIFAQLYEVKFNYENLNTFTVDDESVENGGAVYVMEGASLSLATTFDEDYKMTNDCWVISPTGVGTFTPNASNATYVVGNGDVTITITPKIATYTGQGKWGSKTLRIDTSSVKSDSPWFAAKFATSSSGTNYTWVRFNKISDSSYECVVPDGYDYVRFCRMAKKATTFTDTTTDDIDATTAWNITESFVSLGNTDSEYTLAFVDGDKSKITATKKTNN